MGQLVAEWIVEGVPSLDVWEMDSRRFGRNYASRDYTLARTTEIYSTYYDVKYPGHERQAGRPLLVSPTYPRLAGARGRLRREVRLGAGELVRAERGGGRRVAAAARVGRAACGRRRSERSTSRAARAAALFDETSFAKIEIAGAGAAEFLERLCDNRVARDVGAITYTQMLNERGGIECDFTVTRLAEDRFRIVTGTAFGRHDLAWIRLHAPDDGVQVEDVTSKYACLGLWGPPARDDPPAADDGGRSRSLTCARASSPSAPCPCLALRVTYVGELGWELYCPTELGLRLWDTIWEAGRQHGLVAGGYKAIDSLRLEKGYRVWGSDITPEDTPYEAGLGFAVKLDKGDFIGRDALLQPREPRAQARVPGARRSASVALGSEPVRVDGEIVGRVTSGGYGYTVERSIAYAYLPRRRRRRARRSRWRSSASGSAARSPRNRSSTRPASASAPSVV